MAEPTYLCPQCGEGKAVRIDTAQSVTVNLWGPGGMVVEFHSRGELNWDDDDAAYCLGCGWQGTVGELIDNPAPKGME